MEGIKAMHFASAQQAKAQQASDGGWVFAASDGSGIWFPPSMTLTRILAHPATRGLSGKLS